MLEIHVPFSANKVLSFFAFLEALSIFLAMVLRFLGPERVTNYDSEDDYVPARLPLLRNQAQQASYIADPILSLKQSWNAKSS